MTVHSETYRDYTIEVDYDDFPVSPREWGTTTEIIGFQNNRYTIGDRQIDTRDFADIHDMYRSIQQEGSAFIYPLYMLDHSGITYTIDPGMFRACDPHGWDWGEVGMVVVRFTKLNEVLDQTTVSTDEWRKKAREVAIEEVEEYSRYASGEAYLVHIFDKDGELKDLCGSVYDMDEAIRDAKMNIDAEWQRLNRKQELAYVAGF